MGLRVGAWSAMEKSEKKRRRVEGAKVKVERKGENGGGGGGGKEREVNERGKEGRGGPRWRRVRGNGGGRCRKNEGME